LKAAAIRPHSIAPVEEAVSARVAATSVPSDGVIASQSGEACIPTAQQIDLPLQAQNVAAAGLTGEARVEATGAASFFGSTAARDSSSDDEFEFGGSSARSLPIGFKIVRDDEILARDETLTMQNRQSTSILALPYH